MDAKQKDLARFYAHLASIPSLESLREGERLLLLDDMREVDLNRDAPITRITVRGPEDEPQVKTPLELLSRLHEWAHIYIADLLDGKPVTFSFYPTWRLGKDGQLLEMWNTRQIEDMALFGLIALIKQQPFPFRRCPVCRAIFVPTKRQKYCTPICTYKGVEEARREERKEYLKEYQQQRRKKAKKRSRKQPQTARKEA